MNIEVLHTDRNEEYSSRQLLLSLLNDVDDIRSIAVVVERASDYDGPVAADETGPMQVAWPTGDLHKYYMMFALGCDKIMGVIRGCRRIED